MAKYRNQFDFQHWDGMTLNDFIPVLQRFEPDILHISARFTIKGELVFIDEKGEASKIPVRNFVEPLKFIKGKLKVVVLNGGHTTETLAQQISNYVDFVIGFNESITDEEAIMFSKNFYGAIA